MHPDQAIIEIPVEDLHDSPFNPRQTFDPVADAEMVEDIRAHGRILQPLKVRPRIGPLFQGDPELERTAVAGYEVVFGHRRKRNGMAAGLATLTCMVEAMDDATARRMQISENLSRQDVHPIEEAQGFQALIDQDGETADTLAAKFGKSRSYVYGRLKLLTLVPDVRKACLAKEIDAEAALLVARLRTAALQNKALAYIKNEYRAKLDDGGKASYRAIRDLLNEKFTLDLDKAMFDIEDEMLLPAAGHCLRCPKRSGNAPEFADIAAGDGKREYSTRGHHGANVCTDPDCFDAKKKAHLKREADTLAASGKTVITGNAARGAISAQGDIKGAYIALKDVKADIKKAGAKEVQTVLIQDPRTGKTHQAVKVQDVKAAGVTLAEPTKRSSGGGYDHKAAEADRKKREAEGAATTARNLERLDRVRAALPPTPGLLELRFVARALWKLMGDSNDSEALFDLYGLKHQDVDKAIAAMAPAELTRLCVDCILVDGVTATQWETDREPTNLLAIAAAYGIDLDADQHAEQDSANASTPPPAARAPEKANAAPAAAKGAKGKAKSKPKNQKDKAGDAGGSDAQVGAFAEAGA